MLSNIEKFENGVAEISINALKFLSTNRKHQVLCFNTFAVFIFKNFFQAKM